MPYFNNEKVDENAHEGGNYYFFPETLGILVVTYFGLIQPDNFLYFENILIWTSFYIYTQRRGNMERNIRLQMYRVSLIIIYFHLL